MTVELASVISEAQVRWSGILRTSTGDGARGTGEIECQGDLLPELSGWLVSQLGYSFGGLIVEQRHRWELRYVFYGDRAAGWIHLVAHYPPSQQAVPSISTMVHAADWHEREAEDLFGLTFEGHPRLGDFVLHNDVRQEGVAPMRRNFDTHRRLEDRQPDKNWRPRRIVHEEGAFLMPIGPIHSAATGPVYFSLETVGEDVIRAQPRLFYAYRGLEKIAEGRPAQDALLIAERLSGTSAFAHSLAVCQAVEAICAIKVPQRAQILRVFLAELERFRHHAAAVHGICESTGLAVGASQTAILEEELLRLSGALCGHRYLFGINVLGGLSIDFDDVVLRKTVADAQNVLQRLVNLQRMPSISSSFLDRLEECGSVAASDANAFGMVGPTARASSVSRDLRAAHPYASYEKFSFKVPYESEGDGYARLRLLFSEAEQSVSLMAQACDMMPGGPVRVPEARFGSGAALGWVEAPSGAALHWIRLRDEGVIDRYRLITPSFANWHGFRLAAEKFAFQDFPIILATFALSVPENDR
ncbi:MAG: NADH-quinone oxidoreductase subunit C [Candidatus Binataceae bacterium]